jgi:hypothetical protein
VQIAGILGQGRRVILRRHAVGAAAHDQAVHRLHRPFLFDELDRQPIKQWLIGRQFSQFSKIVRCADDAATKVVLP